MNDFFGSCNLVRDPELKMTKNGTPVASLRGAFRTSRKNMDGGYVTLYLNMNVWGDYANTVSQSLHKGDLVSVKGELQPREYTAKDGTKRNEIELNAREVVFLNKSQNRPSYDEGYNNSSNQQYHPTYLNGAEEVDDQDLPF